MGARGTAIRIAIRNRLFFYRCRCGVFHLTKKPNHDSAQAIDVAIPRLAAAGVKIPDRSVFCVR